jgi:hypothetical protein
VERARVAFQRGVGFVQKQEWGEALEAFRASAALRSHAVTSYNIGVCHRAMARYTLARVELQDALARHEKTGELPSQLVADAKRFLLETEELLARLRFSVDPPDARVLVDGAPLARADDHMIAGVRAAGAAEALPKATVDVVFDPGAHVILVQRKGYDDAVVNRSFAPGRATPVSVSLSRQRARLQVFADRPNASVEISGEMIGAAPVSVEKSAGAYVVVVSADGYERYTADVQLAAGEETVLRATLVEETFSLLDQWWFWSAAGVVVAGAIVGTYFATRDPTRPQLDGGGLGWTVPIE